MFGEPFDLILCVAGSFVLAIVLAGISTKYRLPRIMRQVLTLGIVLCVAVALACSLTYFITTR